jgi:branched-chain amino acid aminotransferase
MSHLNFNGNISYNNNKVFASFLSAFRSGEVLIETMFYNKGEIDLWDYHINRLQQSLSILNYPKIEENVLINEVDRTVKANAVKDCVVRISFFPHDNTLQFLMETRAIPAVSNALQIGIAAGLIKVADNISRLKSSSRLVYNMAKKQAQQHSWNDALLLNQYGRVAESTISNIFWIKNEQIFTPPLIEGCVAGTMRQYLLEHLPQHKISIVECALTLDILHSADEIFLTNAVRKIQSVARLGNKELCSSFTQKIISVFQ